MQTLRTPDDGFDDLPEFPYTPKYHEIPDDDGGVLRVAWVQDGPDNADPVLMLHGLNVQCHTWDPFARELAERHHVIAMDMRGHGDSDWAAAGYRVRSMARDVHGLIDALGLGPVHLVGHSAGVRVAIAVAGERPETVRRLALSDAGPANSKSGAGRST